MKVLQHLHNNMFKSCCQYYEFLISYGLNDVRTCLRHFVYVFQVMSTYIHNYLDNKKSEHNNSTYL